MVINLAGDLGPNNPAYQNAAKMREKDRRETFPWRLASAGNGRGQRPLPGRDPAKSF
jgi:hypothetical protein